MGPSASTTLKAMVNERGHAQNCDPTARYELTLYNFMATVDEASLIPSCGGKELSSYFQKAGLSYYRTLSEDSKLADVLVKELKNRGVACDSQHRVQLISEWDTFYGRNFPEGIKHAFQDGGCISQRSYMRGLDGQLAEPPTSGSRDASSDRKDDTAPDKQQSGLEQLLGSLAPSTKIEP